MESTKSGRRQLDFSFTCMYISSQLRLFAAYRLLALLKLAVFNPSTDSSPLGNHHSSIGESEYCCPGKPDLPDQPQLHGVVCSKVARTVKHGDEHA